ncbi:MAG: YpdA family putative bacillithiol disulfide reductase [Acidobacteriota bacterium]|nr:YpdA family putative bacillithiol disulfide reductase [Acidobacteriota bacterium]
MAPTKTESLLETLPKAQPIPDDYALVDVLIVGAGPTGLACAIEAQKLGLSALLIEKGCLVNSIYNYPANMTFFTTPELLEIGDIPFTTAHQKPTREEALQYYRHVAAHYKLNVRQYEKVETIGGWDGVFQVLTTDVYDHIQEWRVRKIVVSTGYYDRPNLLDVPGESLSKVFHYYREPHPYYDCDVVVVGGKNSAAEAALDLWRHGARVTLVHRGPELSSSLKYWVKPDIENRIKNREIAARFNSTVVEITCDRVVLETPKGKETLENDFVFALIGYHPDFDFLRSTGIELSAEQSRPVCDPETLESNVPGIYVAGVIVSGSRTNEIFIENGRFHGQQIARDLKKKLAAGS